MIVIDCEQGSPEWFAARLGNVTASRVYEIVAKTKTGYSAMRSNYAAELVAERLTGTRQEKYTSDAMKWGSENEAGARTAYEFLTGATVNPVGLVMHPSIARAAASPDGLIGEEGLIEIKCPNTATHIETLLGAAVDGKYIKQMQWQMACTGRQWCDFASFDPRLPGEMQMHITRVNRDPALIAELEQEVSIFLAEIAATEAELRRRYMAEAA